VVLMLAGSAVAQDSGAEIYKAKCEHCHGVDGLSHTFAGKMSGAAQLTSPMAVQMQDADLVAVVTNGKKHMPAFGKKLTADQIEAVVGYVRTLQKAAPADAAPAAK
jgi:mono/diheme cytochrome c family protein